MIIAGESIFRSNFNMAAPEITINQNGAQRSGIGIVHGQTRKAVIPDQLVAGIDRVACFRV